MATRKTTGRTARSSTSTSTARTAKRRAKRTTTSSTRRRTTTGALYPRRRRSRPGLPTTIGSALGALVVTTLLDLSWPARIGVIAVVLVVGLGYVLWRHRAEIAAAASDGDDDLTGRGGPGAVDPAEGGPPPVSPTVAPEGPVAGTSVEPPDGGAVPPPTRPAG